MPVKSLSRGSIAVRIDKPSPDRVIVPAAEVVQARLAVIDIPTVAQGVRSAEGGGHAARYTSMCRRTGDCLWRRR